MQTQAYPASERYFEELVRDGISAAKSGNRNLAQRLLTRATLLNPGDARPWLWLSSTTDEPGEQRTYLERAVAADPSNAAARRALAMLSEKLDKTRLVPEGEAVPPVKASAFEESPSEAFLCPKCGGQVEFSADAGVLTCRYCDYTQVLNEDLAAGVPEQTLDYILPTTRAHRWAEAQHRVGCGQCGAVTMLPPGRSSDRCPYCGSNRFVRPPEAAELLDPQAIGLMKLDAGQAMQQVRKWLGKGLLVPDDLALKASGLRLRSGYYPCWTFDGTLELPWHCEVNEGSSKYPNWVTHSGTKFEFFDDVLVPGLRALDVDDFTELEPFKLDDLAEFAPEYLAGWSALAYDIPLAEASLRGREKVLAKINDTIHAEVEPGREVRDLRLGGGKWSGLTFKHVLLPLWVGTYHFQGKDFRLLVNGQTGKVSGKKPRDHVKAVALTVMAFLIAVIFLILVYFMWLSIGRAGAGG